MTIQNPPLSADNPVPTRLPPGFTADAVRQVLATVIDPNTGRDYVSGRNVTSLAVVQDRVQLVLELGYPARSQVGPVREQVVAALARAGAADAEVTVSWRIDTHAVQRGLKPLAGVRNVVAVASGKGGVGKSTVAANLALALAAEGARVGLLDADIYGPSQPLMLGLSGRPDSLDGKMMEPMQAHGLQVNSIGLLIDVDQPMVWRGPMVTQALNQLLHQTRWNDLDYLLVDMPPGTGDIALTLSQQVPVTGALIVTTPQDVALIDARKGLKMFEKVGVPILGLVENMAVHVCTNCGHAEHVFGAGGARRMAQDYQVELLGELPLDIRIREDVDRGIPTVVADPDGPLARAYCQIARRVAARLAGVARDLSARMPAIKVVST